MHVCVSPQAHHNSNHLSVTLDTRQGAHLMSSLYLHKPHTWRQLFILFMCTYCCSACVKKSTYEALQTKRKAELEATDQLKVRLVTTQAQRDQFKRDKSQLESTLTKERGKNTKLLSDRSELQTSIEQMQAALREQARRQAEVEARISSFKSLLSRFRPLIDTGKLKVQIIEGRMVLVLATDILFDKGSAELSEEGYIAIKDVTSVLASFPDRSFQVEGHTDNDPISTKRYPSNWDLAADRALNVVKAMVESGLPATQVSGASYGDNKPVSSNETDEGKAQNRRIEIVISPDLSKLPGFDELQRLQPK